MLDGGTARRSPATVNRYLAAVFGFYDFHARHGVGVGSQLVAWRRSNRGGYKPFLHHIGKARAVPTRPIGLVVPTRVPRTLQPDEVAAILAACTHLRDRLLIGLLAETGMRVGQALGLRHSDFVSRELQIRIVPRVDNANGARTKTRSVATIPISMPLARLYSAYMHDEYGDLDSDYVFVNLWAAPHGRPLHYQAVHKLVARLRQRSGVDVHVAHAAPHPRHRADPRRGADRGRRPAAHPPLLDHHQLHLRAPRRRRHPRRARPRRRVPTHRGGHPMSITVPEPLRLVPDPATTSPTSTPGGSVRR